MKLPTVEQLSQHIMEMKNEDFEIIPKAQSAYQYELSAVQRVCIYCGASIQKIQSIIFRSCGD